MTPIFRAYRIRNKRDLWPLVADIKRIGTESAKAMLASFYRRLMEHVNTESPEFQEILEEMDGRDQLARATLLNKQLIQQYQVASCSLDRKVTTPFDAFMTFRDHRGSVYLFYHTDGLFLDAVRFLEEDSRVEDFFYTEGMEKPTLVPTNDWRRRALIWKNWGKESNPPMLTLDICRFPIYHQICPMCDPAFTSLLWKRVDQKSSVAALIRAASTSRGTP